MDKEVSEEEVRKFANEIGANFCLVSAKNNYNIEKGFENLIKQLLDPNYVEIIEEVKPKTIYIRKQEKPRRHYICCGFNSRESL